MSVERNDWISGFTQSDFQDRFSYVAPCKIVSKTSCCGTILIWYPKTNGLKNTLDEDPLCKITFQAGNCELFKLFQRNVACWRHFVHLKTAIVWFAFELTESFSTRSRKEHNSDKREKLRWRPSRQSQVNMKIEPGLSRAPFKLHCGYSIFGGHFEIVFKFHRPSYMSSLNVLDRCSLLLI